MEEEQKKQIIHLSIGEPQQLQYGDGKVIQTGICKQPVEQVFLSKDGFRGDRVADLKHHGGLDRAICIYPFEHYLFWEKEFGKTLPKANFGENITPMNMLEKDMHLGDVFRMGEAVVQITQSRIPCSTITKRTNNPLLLKRMIETNYTGYLCRVLEEGIVHSNSEIILLQQDSNNVTVYDANEIYFRGQKDMDGMNELLAIEALADEWKETMIKRLSNL